MMEGDRQEQAAGPGEQITSTDVNSCILRLLDNALSGDPHDETSSISDLIDGLPESRLATKRDTTQDMVEEHFFRPVPPPDDWEDESWRGDCFPDTVYEGIVDKQFLTVGLHSLPLGTPHSLRDDYDGRRVTGRGKPVRIPDDWSPSESSSSKSAGRPSTAPEPDERDRSRVVEASPVGWMFRTTSGAERSQLPSVLDKLKDVDGRRMSCDVIMGMVVSEQRKGAEVDELGNRVNADGKYEIRNLNEENLKILEAQQQAAEAKQQAVEAKQRAADDYWRMGVDIVHKSPMIKYQKSRRDRNCVSEDDEPIRRRFHEVPPNARLPMDISIEGLSRSWIFKPRNASTDENGLQGRSSPSQPAVASRRHDCGPRGLASPHTTRSEGAASAPVSRRSNGLASPSAPEVRKKKFPILMVDWSANLSTAEEAPDMMCEIKLEPVVSPRRAERSSGVGRRDAGASEGSFHTPVKRIRVPDRFRVHGVVSPPRRLDQLEGDSGDIDFLEVLTDLTRRQRPPSSRGKAWGNVAETMLSEEVLQRHKSLRQCSMLSTTDSEVPASEQTVIRPFPPNHYSEAIILLNGRVDSSGAHYMLLTRSKGEPFGVCLQGRLQKRMTHLPSSRKDLAHKEDEALAWIVSEQQFWMCEGHRVWVVSRDDKQEACKPFTRPRTILDDGVSRSSRCGWRRRRTTLAEYIDELNVNYHLTLTLKRAPYLPRIGVQGRYYSARQDRVLFA